MCLSKWNDNTAQGQARGLFVKDGTPVTWAFGFVNSSNAPYWHGRDASDGQSDIEWVWANCCSILKRNGWRYAFGDGINLILGYRDTITDSKQDSIVNSFFTLGLYNNPSQTVWSAYITANRDNGEYDWAIDGYLNHRYNWLHGAYIPSGVSNYTGYAYTDTSQVYQWNNTNYPNASLLTKSNVSEERKTLYARALDGLKHLFRFSDTAYADGRVELLDGKVKVANLSDQQIDAQAITVAAETINKDEFADSLLGKTQRKETKEDGCIVYNNGKDLVEAYPSGAIRYLSDRLETEPVKITKADAENKALDFIEQHGGMPKEFKSSGYSTINQVNLTTEQTETIAYAFTYVPVIGGKPVMGFGSSKIDVMISDIGVVSYMRYVVEPKATKALGEVPSAKKTVEKAASDLQKHFRLSGDTVDIQSVDPVYFGDSFSKESTELRPAWKVTTDRGEAYVDMATGQVLE